MHRVYFVKGIEVFTHNPVRDITWMGTRLEHKLLQSYTYFYIFSLGYYLDEGQCHAPKWTMALVQVTLCHLNKSMHLAKWMAALEHLVAAPGRPRPRACSPRVGSTWGCNRRLVQPCPKPRALFHNYTWMYLSSLYCFHNF